MITGMCLALSICVLFVSLMQSVNRAQFLNNIFLLALFGLSPTYSVVGVVPVTSIYASLNSRKIDLSIELLNLV